MIDILIYYLLAYLQLQRLLACDHVIRWCSVLRT